MMNTPIPIVSVVVTTYNRREKLERALKSVLTQTLKELEVIVVDNASVDHTQELVEGLKDDRIKYIRHATNKGGPAARNTGIKAARASLIAFLDDDDQWQPEKLELQVNKFKDLSLSVGVVYVGAEIFDELKQKVLKTNLPQWRGHVYQRLLLGTMLSSVSSVLVRAECFQKVGLFDEDLTSCQDWDMWLRISKQYEFDYVNEVLARINMHGKQISTNFAAMIPGRTRMVVKHQQEFAKFPAIYVIHLKRLGKMHCINGTWRLGIEWFMKAIKVNRFEAFKIVAWCVLELPVVKFTSNLKGFKRYEN
ncbi:MAG: glycosyltransferase [Candidatus Omnitrophica bacterium]|nr:glycosyltransferase [Candidatus Omnitrophota bacterium]